MMKRFTPALLALLFAVSGARAESRPGETYYPENYRVMLASLAYPAGNIRDILAQFVPMPGMTTPPTISGGSYTGPCDLSGPTCAFGWGLRALKASAANGSTNIAQITCNSATHNIVALTSGAFDTTTAETDCTHGTITGSISTTTLTVTAGGTNIANGDMLFGSGVTAGTTVSGCTGSPVTSCTVSASQTVGSESMTAVYPITVQQYDQIGGSGLTTPATTSPTLLLAGCPNSINPCAKYDGSSTDMQVGLTSPSSPFGAETVALMSSSVTGKALMVAGSGFCSQSDAIRESSNVSFEYGFGYQGSTVGFDSGGTYSSTWVSIATSLAASAASTATINGSLNSGTAASMCSAGSGAIYIGSRYGSADFWTGYIQETVIFSGGLTTGQETSINHNSCTFWSLPWGC